MATYVHIVHLKEQCAGFSTSNNGDVGSNQWITCSLTLLSQVCRRMYIGCKKLEAQSCFLCPFCATVDVAVQPRGQKDQNQKQVYCQVGSHV